MMTICSGWACFCRKLNLPSLLLSKLLPFNLASALLLSRAGLFLPGFNLERTRLMVEALSAECNLAASGMSSSDEGVCPDVSEAFAVQPCADVRGIDVLVLLEDGMLDDAAGAACPDDADLHAVLGSLAWLEHAVPEDAEGMAWLGNSDTRGVLDKFAWLDDADVGDIMEGSPWSCTAGNP